MDNIRIEKVSDVNTIYPYLEVFVDDETSPFLEISISSQRELVYKFYQSNSDIILTSANWYRIYTAAEEFLPQELKNEDDFNASDLLS